MGEQERTAARNILRLFLATSFVIMTVGMWPFLQDMFQEGPNRYSLGSVVFIAAAAGVLIWILLQYYHDFISGRNGRLKRILDSGTKAFVLLAIVTLPFALIATIVVGAVFRNGLAFLPLGVVIICILVLATIVADYRKSGIKADQ